MAAVAEASHSSASSPPYAAHSPTCSDTSSLTHDPERLEDLIPPILRKAVSLSALAAGGKQRRKRSRTTPEQLEKLEEFFAADQSPTAARRRDIARELGLDERQTQIWFQNRRAKVKLQAKMFARAAEKLEPPPQSPPPLTSGFDAEVYNLIHEEEEVTIIPCTDLSVGTWRRVASSKHELIAYVCETRRCLAWFVRAGGMSFKMEVPFDSISESRFSNESPGVGSASFVLERPPSFFVEKASEFGPGIEPTRHWRVSGDWTENGQASVVLQHCLIGPAYQLSHLVNTIALSGSSSDVSLCTPTLSLSDVGSSPEAYPRSCESPVEPHSYTSTLVIRKPSSARSLRMLHHPSLERLRPIRHASAPFLRSPLSSVSTPTESQSQSPAEPSALPVSLYTYTGNGSSQQRGPPAGRISEQLPRLPLTMSDLPHLHYEYNGLADSPHGCSDNHSASAPTTPGYYHAFSPPWEYPFAPQGSATVIERPQQPYYQHYQGFQGPLHARGGGAC
ncbi:homeobox-domain-containing protein [Trametes gibbosa]|nr:homeobox-domain-containing protein [Trametes gibbosa]